MTGAEIYQTVETVACFALVGFVAWVLAKYRPWDSPYQEGGQDDD